MDTTGRLPSTVWPTSAVTAVATPSRGASTKMRRRSSLSVSSWLELEMLRRISAICLDCSRGMRDGSPRSRVSSR